MRSKALQETPDTSTGSGGGGSRGHGVEGGRNISDLCTGSTSSIGGQGGSGGGGGGRKRRSKKLHWRDVKKREGFLRKVLTTAAGAAKLSGAPTPSDFFSVRGSVPDEPEGVIGRLDALLQYGEVNKAFCILTQCIGTTESPVHPSRVHDFSQV